MLHHIAGIVIIIIMFILIIFISICTIIQSKKLNDLEKSQSPLCYEVICPYDSKVNKCKGYSYRDVNGGYYCNNAPNTFISN
jgi:hypothetical protein